MTRQIFSLEAARALLDTLRPRLAEVVSARADLAELRADLAQGTPVRGGLADAKALEARIYADMEELDRLGVLVKGFAPVLLDFPGERDGIPVLWCWLEGEPDIDWYHRADVGFAGRRRCADHGHDG